MPVAVSHAVLNRTYGVHAKAGHDHAHHPEGREDALSDITIDIREFGHPLERMQPLTDVYDDEDEAVEADYDWDFEEENSRALREQQDQSWIEAQAAIRASFAGIDDEDDTPPSSYQPSISQRLPGYRGASTSKVSLKTLDLASDELSLVQYLNSEEMRLDPWNHAAPTLEILEHDQDAYLMMLGLEPYNSPPFQNAHDCLDFTRQLLEGVAFFHEHKISQLDLSASNVGMDVGLAPTQDSEWDRADYPVRYYVIDLSSAIHFGAQRQSGSADWVAKLVDEDLKQCMDEDIRMLGTTLQGLFKEIPHLLALAPLLASMASSQAHDRPSALQALETLETISGSFDAKLMFKPLYTRPPIAA